ncbi:hypothetical protein [Sphingomonas crocodyli]|nr:hypothetical protein [Sphingomonas crocodyli]
MSKIKAMVAALAIGGAMVAAVPAEAQRYDRGYYGDRGWRGGDRSWRGGDRYWRGDRGWRGNRYGYGGYRGPRGYYGYAPRGYGYYGYPRYGYGYGVGYGYPRYRYGYGNDGALIAGIAGLAIGAAIASDGF